jgi:hypothetical protein
MVWTSAFLWVAFVGGKETKGICICTRIPRLGAFYSTMGKLLSLLEAFRIRGTKEEGDYHRCAVPPPWTEMLGEVDLEVGEEDSSVYYIRLSLSTLILDSCHASAYPGSFWDRLGKIGLEGLVYIEFDWLLRDIRLNFSLILASLSI